MASNVRNKNFLTLMDFSPRQIKLFLELARDLKRAKYTGTERPLLKGKNIVILSEQDSTQTRCSFEVAALDQGAHVTYLGSAASQLGKKESIADRARVLGWLYDGIEYRGGDQSIVEDLAKYSGILVWNGLTDADHPTQILADFLTAQEHLNKPYANMIFTYVGDGRNNVANALMIGAAKLGMDFRIVSPVELFPAESLVEKCQQVAEHTGAKITITDEIATGVKNSDVLYTAVWVTLGESEAVWKQRIQLLRPYQVNQEMIRLTNNEKVIFEHCLPSFHNLDKFTGKKVFDKFGLKEMEVCDAVFEGEHSVVYDEAENRMYTIKAVMVATLGV